jgi:hypothetical protein
MMRNIGKYVVHLKEDVDKVDPWEFFPVSQYGVTVIASIV